MPSHCKITIHVVLAFQKPNDREDLLVSASLPKTREVRLAPKTMIVLERVGRAKDSPHHHHQSHHSHIYKPMCNAIEPAGSTLIMSQRMASPVRRKCGRKGHGSANPTKRDHPGLSPSIRQLLTWNIKMKKCLCLKPS